MKANLRYIILKFLVLLIVSATVLGCKKDTPKVPKKTIVPIVITDAESVAFDSTVAFESKSEAVNDFYRAYTFHTVWNKKALRDKVLKAISESEVEGLSKTDYNYKMLALRYPIVSVQARARYDVAMSKAALDYLHDLYMGKIDQTKSYGSWDFYRKSPDVSKMLSDAVQNDSLEYLFEKAKPDHPNYHDLKKALVAIDKFGDQKLEKIEYTEKIMPNDSGAVVLKVKKILVFWKDLKQDSLTDKYGKDAQISVRAFQRRHGLTPDGIIGRTTIAALNFTKAQRKQQIIANLERWRWFPRKFAKQYIIVNIPDYRLQYIKEGETIVEKRVVVGKLDRQTPILTSKFSNIVINPTWTVPPTILKEDILPAATKNRGYFARKDIVILDSKMDTVTPEDWNPERYEYYRYVQKPSYENSLGIVKFNFPNRFMVYLHDTNHRDFFARNYRSLSSGCVRVENPLPFAETLLDDEKRYKLDSLQKKVDIGKTEIIYFNEKIYLYQLYWTASFSKSGKLQFAEDIYNLDKDLYKRLNK